MANCVHRKNKGVSVVFRTHLLLYSKDFRFQSLYDWNELNARQDHLPSQIKTPEFYIEKYDMTMLPR